MANHSDLFVYFLNHIHVVRSDTEKQSLLQEIVDVESPKVVSFINAHGINLSANNEGYKELFTSADWLLRDGIGVSLLYKWVKREGGLNMNGTDFIPEILAAYKASNTDYTIALLGTESPFLDTAAERLKAEGHTINHIHHGFEADEYYLKLLQETPSRVIVLAMGMPKQERIAKLLCDELDYPCIIVSGGAILDFLSNRFKRAPLWIRRINLEWLYRFTQEPKRLMKRTSGYAIFILRVLKNKKRILSKLN